MKLPIENVVEELVARGYHAGVRSEWHNRALLAKRYQEKLQKWGGAQYLNMRLWLSANLVQVVCT